MCGLVGIISFKKSGFFKADVDKFYDMLVINSLRGMHSTGIFGVQQHKKEVDWAKALGSPYAAMSEQGFKRVFEKGIPKYNIMVGHGRFATRGDITSVNAHPYEVGPITMVHNGSLFNCFSLEGFSNFPVDSQYLAWSIANKGVEKTYEEVQGAMAVIYYDKREEALFAFRNNERPLWIMEIAEEEILLSSEEATLHWIKHKYSPKGCEDPKFLQPNLLYKFSPDHFGWRTKELTPYTTRPFQGRYLPPPPEEPSSKIIHLPATRKRRVLHSYLLGHKSVKNGERIQFLLDDIQIIYDRNNTPVRYIVRGYSPDQEVQIGDGIAEIIANVPATSYTEEELYNADYFVGTIRNMVRDKTDRQVRITTDLEGLVCLSPETREKARLLFAQKGMCSQCNSLISEEDESVVTDESPKKLLCKSCGGL